MCLLSCFLSSLVIICGVCGGGGRRGAWGIETKLTTAYAAFFLWRELHSFDSPIMPVDPKTVMVWLPCDERPPKPRGAFGSVACSARTVLENAIVLM